MRLLLTIVAFVLLLLHHTASAETSPPNVAHCAGLARPSPELRSCLDDAIATTTAAIRGGKPPSWCPTDAELVQGLPPGAINSEWLAWHARYKVCERLKQG